MGNNFPWMVQLLVLVTVTSASLTLPNISQPTVFTPLGKITGTRVTFLGTTLDAYFGIPFAQPPVGLLRFKKTVPVSPWKNQLQANKMPPACVQYTVGPFPWKDYQPGQSEDCLYLNIWIPEGTSALNKKTVMFWIYGGGYNTGSNRIEMYDATALFCSR
uniref:U15-Austrotoxin-Ht1a_1 n=1 Tax=Hickmania troglodytes TaxID=489260 RepID=A0A482Z8Q6_9ARAC